MWLTDIILLWIHPSTDGHLGDFYVFAVVNSATVNKGAQLSLWNRDFVSFGYILRYGIPGSHSSPSFKFSMNVHTVSYSGCTNLYSHRQYTKALFSPHPYQYVFLVFLITAILTRVRRYLIVVLICIFLMINDIEHLLIYLLVISVSSLDKCLFRSSAHFESRFLLLLLLNCWISYRLWVLTPFIRWMLCKYFLLAHRLPFHVVMLLLLWRSFSVWWVPRLDFALLACAFGIISAKLSQRSMSKSVFLPFLLVIL